MGAAILITLGVLFLLHTYGVVRINESIPVLLLVTGGILLISRAGSTEGHVQPGWIEGPTAPPPPQPEQWVSGAGNPPSSSDQNDSQVKP
jgi:hypothetical protein